jgi:hypothetical protein
LPPEIPRDVAVDNLFKSAVSQISDRLVKKAGTHIAICLNHGGGPGSIAPG